MHMPTVRSCLRACSRHRGLSQVADLLRRPTGWLAARSRHLGDRVFAANDAQARVSGWQINPIQGGLGRRYRDPRFDSWARQRHEKGEAEDDSGSFTSAG